LKGMRASIIVIFLALLIGFGVYFTMIKEKKAKIVAKEKQYKELEAKLNKTIAVVKRKQEAMRKLKIVSARWKQAKKMLPTEESISSLLTTLTKKGAENEVKIKHFKPMGRASKEKYDEVRIQMQVYGGYHNIAGFMAALNNMERIVNVRDLKLSPAKGETEEEIKISATFDLVTYLTKGGKVEG
jgi:type IV pilus assembly protein PilO